MPGGSLRASGTKTETIVAEHCNFYVIGPKQREQPVRNGKDPDVSNRMFPVSLIALALIALLIGGCGDGADRQQDTAARTQSGPGAVVGGAAPDFQLLRLDGSTLKLSDLRGKAVLLDFWDTWCPPCRAAMPHLQEISTAYDGDLVVVGIAFGQQGKDAVAKFIADRGLTFEFVLADQKVISDFGGLQSIPTTFLVDRNGEIVEKWVGGQTKSTYESAVQSVLES